MADPEKTQRDLGPFSEIPHTFSREDRARIQQIIDLLGEVAADLIKRREIILQDELVLRDRSQRVTAARERLIDLLARKAAP